MTAFSRFSSASREAGERALSTPSLDRRLHLANLRHLRALLWVVLGVNAAVLVLGFLTWERAVRFLDSAALVRTLTWHRLLWIGLDAAAVGVIGRELAAPGSTARLAVIELAVILANMLLVVSLIYPLYPYYHTISLYYVAIFSLVPLLRLSLARSFAAIALPGLALLVGILHQEPLAPINLSNAINLVAMTVLTLVSMRYLHAERVRDLLQQDIIARQQAELGRQALTDALTGLANRRCLDAALAREWRNTAREGVDLSAVMIDIDYFKQFNDTSGHAAGDACLRLVAGCIARHLRRAGDMAARYGGEEFLVLLPGVDRDEARILAEAIRREILDANLPHPGSPFARVSVSLGVASRGPDAQDTPQALLARADAALYAAKADGRNRVRLAEADPAH